MKSAPSCPRCGGAVREPGLWSSSWRCEQHGSVPPVHAPARQPAREAVEHVIKDARVPVWLPWPLPLGWVVTGCTYAGDDRSGAVATVVACSGPSPLGGGSELILVAEEPGVGLGARYAGLPGPDPGGDFGTGAPNAKMEIAGHPAALWCLGAPNAAVFVGEAAGSWLWAVLWPESAGVLLLEDLHLRDLREAPLPDLPFGALCPRLIQPAAA